jgi:precorrin-6B methylase 2
MTDLSQIKLLLETLEQDVSLHNPKNFDERANALEFIEFHLVESVKDLPLAESELMDLRKRVENLLVSLEEIDKGLVEELRKVITSGQCQGKAFENLIGEYFDVADVDTSKEGYDNLDVFVNCLLSIEHIPEQTRELLPEMVFYQKTPARVVFEIAKNAGLTKDDVFVDIGCGLGQVGILINLITGIPVYGIEYEPAFCDFANECAAALNRPEVTSINADAREVDYSIGTIFFMYTPFKGEMLKQVLRRLKEQAVRRQIKVITYGPCTAEVKLENWLYTADVFGVNNLVIFESIVKAEPS